MLKEDGYVNQEPYGYLELTDMGREKAKALIQREQLITDSLNMYLNFPARKPRRTHAPSNITYRPAALIAS